MLDVIQQCENGGRTKYCRFDISTYYLGVNFSENSLNCNNLKPRGWDKQVMWMGYADHVDGIRKSHGVLPMEQLVLSDKWARKLHSR